MKIVHIDSYFEDSFGYQINILPKYHAMLGHDVTIITSTKMNQQTPKESKRVLGEYLWNGCKVKRIPILFDFKQRCVFYKDLYSELINEKPDYIFMHAVTSFAIWDVCKYKKLNKDVFVAVDNHADLNISGKNRLWKIIYYNLFWKKNIKLLDKYIDIYFGVTPIRCAFLEEELGVSSTKIRLLPIGADVKGADISLGKKLSLEIPKADFYIVHGGKMTYKKRTDKLIEAFKRVKDDSIRLLLFGRIEDEKLLADIKDEPRIIYLGWLNRDETLKVLSIADLGIWNTQHTTLLEDAVAVGLPLILNYYGSTSHLIKDSGRYIYSGTTKEIQDTIGFLCSHREVVTQYRKGAEELKDLLSYESIANESLEYAKNMEPQRCHKIFMDKECTDWEYPNLRKLNY